MPSDFACTKMLRYLIFYCSFGAFFATSMYVVNPGPQHPPTKGEVWPKPQQEIKEDLFYEFDPAAYHVKVTSHSCTILTNAIHRYSSALLRLSELARSHRQRQNVSRRRRPVCAPDCGAGGDGNHLGALRELRIELTAPCENYPHFDMDEQYELTVDLISELKSDSIWGILRGLETSSQLFYLTDNGNDVVVNKTHITDYPRYPHRGLLLDTSRHYISVGNILLTLDGMAMNKMNVFHWHIVDDQSFPYVSEKFPNLSKYGAFHPTMVYTKADVQNIINYARDRGIRVVPEFDVPGHTRSWGVAYPSVLTPCYELDKEIGLGPMNPINDATYKLLRDLFQELQSVFPDQYFHVGGDEVELACWASNAELLQYMREHNMSSVAELHSLFMERAIPLLGDRSTPIVWQEVFDNGVPLSNDTIVQVWKGDYIQEMKELLAAGKRVLFSSAWYLDHLGDTWEKFYRVDPRTLVGANSRATRIVGGEACMWGEMVDDRNVISRVWPRASAVAERLWSEPQPGLEYAARYGFPVPELAFRRIEEHACRMARRGLAAEPPAGPGYCALH